MLAAPCPRALRYPHAEGRRDFPGKAAQSQRSMGYRLLSLFGGRVRGGGQCGNHREGRHKLEPDYFLPGPIGPQC